jgi:hypothetical protein
MVIPSAALLTVPLTVAVHRIKKPCIYNGFDNLNTDGHGWTRIYFAGRARHSVRAVTGHCTSGAHGVTRPTRKNQIQNVVRQRGRHESEEFV